MVRRPCRLDSEMSIMFWRSSHWRSAASPPPSLGIGHGEVRTADTPHERANAPREARRTHFGSSKERGRRRGRVTMLRFARSNPAGCGSARSVHCPPRTVLLSLSPRQPLPLGCWALFPPIRQSAVRNVAWARCMLGNGVPQTKTEMADFYTLSFSSVHKKRFSLEIFKRFLRLTLVQCDSLFIHSFIYT